MLITVGSVLRDGEENKYILDEMIGRGGFANVFKAHRESAGPLFAVKTLLPSFNNAVHIYNSDLKPFAIENVLGFISGCA